MSETKYETLTLGQALDAVANGEEVEYAANPIGNDCWDILRKYTPFAPDESKNWQFRRLIQPKKKIAPFTFETFPRGAWIRIPNAQDFMPINITQKYVGGYKYESLLHLAKLLVIENGRVVGEKPCGMEVEE